MLQRRTIKGKGNLNSDKVVAAKKDAVKKGSPVIHKVQQKHTFA